MCVLFFGCYHSIVFHCYCRYFLLRRTVTLRPIARVLLDELFNFLEEEGVGVVVFVVAVVVVVVVLVVVVYSSVGGSRSRRSCRRSGSKAAVGVVAGGV